MTIKEGDKVRQLGLAKVWLVTYIANDGKYTWVDVCEVDGGYKYETFELKTLELAYEYDFQEVEVAGRLTREHVYVKLMFDKNTGLFVADQESYEHWMESQIFPDYKIVREQ